MTIKHAFFSVRRYGLRGIIDFLKAMLERDASARKMAATLVNNPSL